VVASPGIRSEINEGEKKIYGSDTILERCVPSKVICLYCLMEVHIYIYEATYLNPSLSRLRRR
jgi:hypothetical protein